MHWPRKSIQPKGSNQSVTTALDEHIMIRFHPRQWSRSRLASNVMKHRDAIAIQALVVFPILRFYPEILRTMKKLVKTLKINKLLT